MNGEEIILRRIENDLEKTLNRCGIMFRIFGRVKSIESIEKKFTHKNYIDQNKKMQDLFGVRITLYFSDDKELLYDFLKNDRHFDNESINNPSIEKFCPQVLNMVMKLPESSIADFNLIKKNYAQFSDYIDSTYEIQIRTVLSEGWHEVDHDLRYKHNDDWTDYRQYGRLLNGVFATLETSEWSMLSIFDNLAHSHYKNNNWNSVLRQKMRIRFKVDDASFLSQELLQYVSSKENHNTARLLYKTSRSKVLKWILNSEFDMPLTYDTILFLLNRLGPKDEKIISMEPQRFTKEMNDLLKTP
ncbi:MAG: GTP pyrophosphokinase [Bacteroidales bacterium]|nr:GTP pyrophosphokinase [Bacteroidales bacterium]